MRWLNEAKVFALKAELSQGRVRITHEYTGEARQTDMAAKDAISPEVVCHDYSLDRCMTNGTDGGQMSHEETVQKKRACP